MEKEENDISKKTKTSKNDPAKEKKKKVKKENVSNVNGKQNLEVEKEDIKQNNENLVQVDNNEKTDTPKNENSNDNNSIQEDLKKDEKNEQLEVTEDLKNDEKGEQLGATENSSKDKKSEQLETTENSKNGKSTIANSTANPKEYSTVKSKPSKKVVGIVITFTVIIVAIMLFSIIFALLNINNNKILKGISILDIDVGDLTIDQATQRINDAINQKFTNEKESIVLKREGVEVSINANMVNAKFDIDTAVAEAYNIGRDGNIITNNYSILWTKLFKKEIEPTLYFDAEFMSTIINDISSKMSDGVKDYSYYIENNKLIVVNGKAGYSIKSVELSEKITQELRNIHIPYQEIEIPVEYKEPKAIDIEKIRNEIYKAPKDAYVEKNPTKVHVEENGIDFGISIDEAKKLLKEDKKEYEIPLKITKPSKKLSDLGEEAFPEQLATFSTIYDASAINRAANIELATKKINGTVIMPGETFSYNKIVGSRTIEAGWKEGTAYISGKVVPSVGGGVCQVSSTLYNTALLANLEITERTNHTFTVDYVSASRDATVYYGSLDFCFKNTRTYPVKIVATASNGVCKVSLYGIKEEVEYEVIIQSKITSYISNTTTYKEDPTLEAGKEKIEQYGFNGCRSEGYKILKLNGKVVSQTLLSKDTYSPQERIVRRGTKN